MRHITECLIHKTDKYGLYEWPRKWGFAPTWGCLLFQTYHYILSLMGSFVWNILFTSLYFTKKNKQRPNRRNILLVRQHEKSSNKERQLRIRRISRPKQRQAPNTQAPPRAGHSLTCVFFPKSNTISQSLQVIQLK